MSLIFAPKMQTLFAVTGTESGSHQAMQNNPIGIDYVKGFSLSEFTIIEAPQGVTMDYTIDFNVEGEEQPVKWHFTDPQEREDFIENVMQPTLDILSGGDFIAGPPGSVG